jgi:adenosine deaminase
MTSELAALVDAFGYGWAELQWFTVNAMKSAFIGFDDRLALINDQIKPGYAALMGAAGVSGCAAAPRTR